MIALSTLQVRNLLSFGEQGVEVELGPLNVLIGPNGSGKSNLIEVIGLLNSAPEELAEPFRETGGVAEWIWKGESKGFTAIIEATANATSSRHGRATICTPIGKPFLELPARTTAAGQPVRLYVMV